MGKYKRLVKNTAFVFIGNIGPRLISFVLMPFYTFWLSESDFGIQDIISVYSVLLIPFITLGLYEAVFVFPKGKDRTIQSTYFTTAIYVTITTEVILGIIFLLLPHQFRHYILPDKLIDYSGILYFLIVIESFQRILQSFTRGIDKLKVFSITGVVYSIVMLSFSLPLIPKYGLNGYWFSLIIADLSSVLYTFFSIIGWSYIFKIPKWKTVLKEMLYFSIPLVPNATMWWIINSINRPILINNVGLDGVGLYAIAGKFPSILNILFTIFFSAFQISALEEYNRPNFNKFYTNVFRALLCGQIIITVGFALFGDLLFKIFIDEKFFSAVYYLPILCLGVVFSNIACFVGVSFTIVKQTKYFLYSTIIGAGIAIIANLTLIPSFGIMGACISILLSQVGMSLYRYSKSTRYAIFENIKPIALQFIIYISIVVFYYCLQSILIRNISIVFCSVIILYLNKDILKARIFKLLFKTTNH